MPKVFERCPRVDLTLSQTLKTLRISIFDVDEDEDDNEDDDDDEEDDDDIDDDVDDTFEETCGRGSSVDRSKCCRTIGVLVLESCWWTQSLQMVVNTKKKVMMLTMTMIMMLMMAMTMLTMLTHISSELKKPFHQHLRFAVHTLERKHHWIPAYCHHDYCHMVIITRLS